MAQPISSETAAAGIWLLLHARHGARAHCNTCCCCCCCLVCLRRQGIDSRVCSDERLQDAYVNVKGVQGFADGVILPKVLQLLPAVQGRQPCTARVLLAVGFGVVSESKRHLLVLQS